MQPTPLLRAAAPLHRLSGALAALGLTLGMAGCALGPLFTAAEPPPAGMARLYVYRPYRTPGKPFTHHVYLDAREQPLSLPNRSWLQIDLHPGRHSIRVEDVLGIAKCGPVAFTLQAGQVEYIADHMHMPNMPERFAVWCTLDRQTEAQATHGMKGLNEMRQD